MRPTLAVVFVGIAFSALAQEPSPSASSVPGWASAAPTKAALSDAAQTIAPAIYYLGNLSSGWYGTGVCIKTKERLLAAAAHIADIRIEHDALVAVRNGTRIMGKDSYYRVAKVWYHCLVPRVTSDGFVFPGIDPGEKGALRRVDALYGFDVAEVVVLHSSLRMVVSSQSIAAIARQSRMRSRDAD